VCGERYVPSPEFNVDPMREQKLIFVIER